VSKTITEGLRPYAIGEKLRGLRLKKSMGLVELGKHTGLSPAMLSKLERDKLFPTLPTLLRIAMVFSVGLDYFFTDERKRHVVAVVRKKERLRFAENMGSGNAAYHFESLDFPANQRKFNAFLAEFELGPSDRIKLHQHAGVEFLYVIRGRLDLTIGSDVHSLEAGDSIYFDSGVRHGYRGAASHSTTAVVVTAA
jgi:quercetin dioxygenase-like cupin family protein/DNA-binding XRE family transcriptional regulator